MKLTVLKYDLHQIRNDPMLILSTIAPILIWMILKYIFPILATVADNQWSIDINPYFLHTAVALLTLIPMLFGIIYGFILLDERDAGIITAISVTPLGKSGYLKLRMTFPVIFSCLAVMVYCITLNISEQLAFGQLFILALILSLNAPILLLFLGAFASNKVEGIAISKGFGLLLTAILIDYLVPPPYDWLAGYSPLFWIERAYFSTGLNEYIVYTVISLITHLLLFGWLLRKFENKSI
ncbi:hypothetical protein ACFLU5_06360 [Bacteroidota bacterium]